MFHKDDYELLALQMEHCPYCRKSIDEWWTQPACYRFHRRAGHFF